MDATDRKPVIAIMRPQGYVEGSRKLAESFGFDVVAVPMIELEAMEDEYFGTFAENVFSGISDYVIFTSANGIDFTLEKIPVDRRDEFIEALNITKVIAIGPTTRKQLENLGIEVMGMPGVYSSEGLVEFLCPEVKGKNIDTARSAYGSKLLITGLRDCGANVLETKVYTLTMPKGPLQEELITRSLNKEIDVFAFTSSMMVRSFFDQAAAMGAGEKIREVLADSLVAAIGIPTANTLKEYDVEVNVTPDEYTFKEILKVAKAALDNN
ncbi:uroporphyrinogen-III synthase [Methanococcoides orientis]|uniref:uroporphyrinogen-III synthase n=1 Tax=Methanococcoides orientis TaxID=2822137 RepID=UPI001E462B1E|nr:uroporphyrinogen-III synthase [Methanococcoides orientis]UGV39842.1 uroporphyrinogen-III synthase [Methanococcoides orientis]